MADFPNAVEVVTLFVDDIAATKAFYQAAFNPHEVYADAVSSVLKFDGLMINLLQSTEAPQLVEPIPVAAARSGARALFTIKVADVDAVHAELQRRGVVFLNGPIDRPWGRRTAAFADPSGHAWEIAQELPQNA